MLQFARRYFCRGFLELQFARRTFCTTLFLSRIFWSFSLQDVLFARRYFCRRLFGVSVCTTFFLHDVLFARRYFVAEFLELQPAPGQVPVVSASPVSLRSQVPGLGRPGASHVEEDWETVQEERAGDPRTATEGHNFRRN